CRLVGQRMYSVLLDIILSHLDHFLSISLFFLTPPPPPQTSTLSLHDALPISHADDQPATARLFSTAVSGGGYRHRKHRARLRSQDRKSTRLNSSHRTISYAVFCLKKKKKKTKKDKINSK